MKQGNRRGGHDGREEKLTGGSALRLAGFCQQSYEFAPRAACHWFAELA